MVTSTGWVAGFRTVEGGMVCGRLDLPVHADPQDAGAGLRGSHGNVGCRITGTDSGPDFRSP